MILNRFPIVLVLVLVLVLESPALLAEEFGSRTRTRTISEVVIPRLPTELAVDGVIDTREWACAAQIGPLVRVTDGLAEGQTTAVLVGWREDSLYVAIRQSIPENRVAVASTATSAAALQRADHVTVNVAGLGKSKRTVVLWPGRAFLVGGNDTSSTNWVCQSRLSKEGWEAELRLPLDHPEQPVTLTVERAELSVDPVAHQATAQLRVGEVPLAVRVAEAGEFSQGKYQGALFELVNFGDKPLTVEWTGRLQGQPQVKQTVELGPQSQRALRLAMPITLGVYEIQYEFGVGGATQARGQFAFDAGGPISIGIYPFLLWRDGMYIRTRLELERPAELSVQLLNSSGKATGAASQFSAPALSVTEQFISLQAIKPGGYSITLEARDGEQVFARRILRGIKLPAPAWWDGTAAARRAPEPVTLRKLGGREIYKQPVEYPVGGHFNSREGTLEFWMRLEAPAEDGGKNQFALFCLENPFESMARMRLDYRTVFSDKNYVFLYTCNGRMMDAEVGNPYIVTVEDTQPLVEADVGEGGRYPRTPRLKSNEWHHVALTWKGYPKATVTLYLDGKVVLRPLALASSSFYDLEACTLQLPGAHYHDNITFDELRVSNVARTEAEIASTAAGTAPVAADIYTTLLDRFEQLVEAGEDSHTVAEVTSRPDDCPGGRLQPGLAGVAPAEGKFGKGLKTLQY